MSRFLLVKIFFIFFLIGVCKFLKNFDIRFELIIIIITHFLNLKMSKLMKAVVKTAVKMPSVIPVVIIVRNFALMSTKNLVQGYVHDYS